MAAGGDFTSDGHFGSPVQVAYAYAYAYDDNTLVGKYPEFKISSQINSMFGEDFLEVDY
jgi:PmbA protein